MRKTVVEEDQTSRNEMILKNWPSCKGYSPCKGYSLCKMVWLGEKLKWPRKAQNDCT